MSSPAECVQERGAGRRTATDRPALPALARAEARLLLRHPAVVAGATMAVLIAVAGSGVDFGILVLSGGCLVPLAVGALVATNLGSSRSRRHGADELFGALPVTAATRDGAHLASVGAVVVLAAAVLGVAAVAVAGRGGPELRMGGTIVPRAMAPAELAQGPLAVGALGILGVALPRVWAGLLAVPFVALTMVPQGGTRWFLPIVNHSVVVPGGYWPHPEIAPATELIRLDVASLDWHLLYLAGVAGVAVAAVLLRHRTSAEVVSGLVLAVAGAAAGGVLQLR